MKRDVRIKLDYTITIDDDKKGIPFVKDEDILDFIVGGLKMVVPDCYIHSGAKLSIALTRASINEALKKLKDGRA
jgi:hypothetical protein